MFYLLQTKSTFLKLAGPQLVQMFIGDGAKLVRDAFALVTFFSLKLISTFLLQQLFFRQKKKHLRLSLSTS